MLIMKNDILSEWAECRLLLYWIAVLIKTVGETVHIERVVDIVCFIALRAWNQARDKTIFAEIGMTQPYEPKDAEGEGADEIDEEIADGVSQTGIEIAAVDDKNAAIGGGDFCLYDVFNMAHVLCLLRVKGDTVNALQNHIFLHVDVE